jgi:hypothetical protein
MVNSITTFKEFEEWVKKQNVALVEETSKTIGERVADAMVHGGHGYKKNKNTKKRVNKKKNKTLKRKVKKNRRMTKKNKLSKTKKN